MTVAFLLRFPSSQPPFLLCGRWLPAVGGWLLAVGCCLRMVIVKFAGGRCSWLSGRSKRTFFWRVESASDSRSISAYVYGLVEV